MSLEWKWEPILQNENQETCRLKVIGGWVLRVKIDGKTPAIAMTFIPDPFHRWSVTEVNEANNVP